MTARAFNERDWQRYVWRARRFHAFARRQEVGRRWVSAVDLAERCGKERDTQEGYRLLLASILAGGFEQAGRCRALYLHPASVSVKMTRQRARDALLIFGEAVTLDAYIAPCWFPRDLARRWCVENAVTVAGWLDAIEPPAMVKSKGRSSFDDRAPLAVMKTLAMENPSLSGRELARHAVKHLQMKPGRDGAALESIIDRLRHKYASNAGA